MKLKEAFRFFDRPTLYESKKLKIAEEYVETDKTETRAYGSQKNFLNWGANKEWALKLFRFVSYAFLKILRKDTEGKYSSLILFLAFVRFPLKVSTTT